MIEQINRLYEREVQDNELLKSWVNKLAEFILINYYQTEYIDENQWNSRKMEIVKKIVKGEQL